MAIWGRVLLIGNIHLENNLSNKGDIYIYIYYSYIYIYILKLYILLEDFKILDSRITSLRLFTKSYEDAKHLKLYYFSILQVTT